MTDQYKELREHAQEWKSRRWAKQALQLLDEMEAVGAGGVSGKPLTKGSGLGWMEKLVEGGHGMPFVDLIPGEQMMIDAGMSKLHEWVDLIRRADDETKAILRMGLKEEIELMFSRSVDHPSEPEYGDWIERKGGENPVPGKKVQVKLDQEYFGAVHESGEFRWDHVGGGDITSYRVVK